jgi:osmoprotectant transport system ATP-binding protein
MNEVELIGVRKHYGHRYVLNDVSVGFRKEKITAVIGRSGSGKSTLVKTINGLVHPSEGKVIISGQPLDYGNIQLQRRKIGYVVQGNGLFPHLNVEQNISLPGKIAKQTGDVQHLLSFVNLPPEYAKKYPWQLSGGEQQRVAICRALFLNPPIVLMDEPFSSLDTYTRRDLHEKILELRKTFNLTIILVTHDIPEAERLADDIIVVDQGRIVKS